MATLPINFPGRALNANVQKQAGALLYVYRAGTTTPVTTYSDAALTTAQAFPLVADANGVFQQPFVPSGTYKINVTTAAGVALPGYPIDGVGALVSTSELDSAVASVSTSLSIYRDRATLAAATVPVAVKRVLLQFHTAANLVGGHWMRRISLADLTNYPAASYTRSVDRFMPDGSTNSTNGGYWIIDEESPTVAMFGGVPDGALSGAAVISGTDCSAAAQAWIDFHYTRGGTTTQRNVGDMKWGAGKWRVSQGLDFTVLRTAARLYKIDGFGATLYCDAANDIIFDFTDCEYFFIDGFHAYGSPTLTPLCFIKTGRVANGNTAARWRIDNCSTRVNSALASQWRVAALWAVQSETTESNNNIWENWRAVADDPLAVGAAFDTTNYLGWANPKTISSITRANPGVVTTAAAHGYANGDIIAFSENCDMVELVGTAYKVANSTSTTFQLTDLNGANVNTTSFTAFTVGSVHREKVNRGASLSMHATGDIVTSPSAKELATRSTPWARESNKHNVHVKDTFYAPQGLAAIWQGACEDNHFLGCFAVGQVGYWFSFEDDVTGFACCTFQVHLEAGPLGTSVNWAVFSRETAANLVCKVIDCKFSEIATDFTGHMFALDVGTEDVRFIGGGITVARFNSLFTSGASALFESAVQFTLYGVTVVLDDVRVLTNELMNANTFSGFLGSATDSLAILKLPSIPKASLPLATTWTNGLIMVPDDVGGLVPAFCDGTNWRRVQDRNVIS